MTEGAKRASTRYTVPSLACMAMECKSGNPAGYISAEIIIPDSLASKSTGVKRKSTSTRVQQIESLGRCRLHVRYREGFSGARQIKNSRRDAHCTGV